MDRVTHPITAQSRTRGPTPELLTGSCQSVTQNTKGNMLVIPTNVGANSVIDVTHQYDALGRRVARTASGSTTVFVQVDQQTICDYVSGEVPASSTYRYLYSSYIDEPIVRIATSNSEKTWYYHNQQYSIIACTNPTGAATEQYVYMAYALLNITYGTSTVRTFSAINSRYTHTGREWDAAPGMYHYPAGMYEATVDRFCSRDPIGYADGSCQYNFISLSPPSGIDPFGLFDLMRYHPMPQLIQMGRQLESTINGTVRSIGRSIESSVKSLLTLRPPGKGCAQYQERFLLKKIKILNVDLKIYLTRQASLCQDECGCMTVNASAGLEATLKAPLPYLAVPGTDIGIFLSFGLSATAGITSEFCPGFNHPKMKGWIGVRGYAGVRASFGIQPPYVSDWVSGVAFAEVGVFASIRFELPSLNVSSASAGWYHRARAEITYRGYPWEYQRTYEYSRRHCTYGTCDDMDAIE